MALVHVIWMGDATLFRMIPSLTGTSDKGVVGIALVFTFVSVVSGVAMLRSSDEEKERANLSKRVYLAILGIITIFMRAGLLICPELAIIDSLMPFSEYGESLDGS
jgi:hypothetical protein